MNGRCLVTLFALAFLLHTSGAPNDRALAQKSDPITSLAGRWAGPATLVPESGPTQAYNCVATYFPTDNGSRLTQNLRCKSPDYQFDATTQLQIADGKITGRWKDKVNNIDGNVNGTVKPDGFDILLSGDFFDAKMTVVNAPCQQSVKIVLEEGLPVKTISAVLKKC